MKSFNEFVAIIAKRAARRIQNEPYNDVATVSECFSEAFQVCNSLIGQLGYDKFCVGDSSDKEVARLVHDVCYKLAY